jgi:hypothetical protein
MTYMVDAAGGGSAPTRPILLVNGQTVMGSSPTETHTLTRTARSDSSLGRFSFTMCSFEVIEVYI